uniref:Uncharacterized protein n=1 Tax=Globisporangium ultimum (strain ATCC 200006 / CBS 805.95 / DAOM BR144) TaxID=431595 RepID=K3X4D2_GLOUD
MIDLLYTSTDIALADATLFLLEYMIELFDIDSSDSESDSELELVARSGEGILLLQSVLTSAHTLPNHPLIMNGIARYLRSLSAAVVLPSDVYLQASLNLCRGLNFAASFAVAAQALLQNSNSISKYTEVSERAELLQTLLAVSSTSPTPDVSISARGDLLEATFRTMGGISNADFANFCNAVLTSIMTSMQSSHADECASAIALLGRAISGVQAPKQALALVDQIWGIVGASIARHQADTSCRDGAVQLFLNVAPVLDAHHVHIQREILDLCLRWYPESFAGEILKCCIAIVTKEKANAEFEATVEQIIPVRDVPVEDLDAGERNIAAFCENHRNVALASQEIIQFMQLIRQVQEISDAACDLILDACTASQESCVREMEQFTTSITRGVLSYFGPKRVHYRQRNLWEFLFQVLHSPRVPSHIQGLFRAALSACVFESTALRGCLSLDALHDVQAEMLALRQRHRFR